MLNPYNETDEIDRDIILSQVIEIITGDFHHGIIKISKDSLSNLGYSEIIEVDEKLLNPIYLEAEKITDIDIDEIKHHLHDKVIIN